MVMGSVTPMQIKECTVLVISAGQMRTVAIISTIADLIRVVTVANASTA